MILYRPVNIEELEHIYKSGMRAFPPRLPGQPIFYPVLNLEYATEIAERWNAPGPMRSGYVTKFVLDEEYGRQFDQHQVGASYHLELWVPASDLLTFNQHISAPIEVVAAFFGDDFRGHIPNELGLKNKDATAQFIALARTLELSVMDFRLEVKANNIAIFLNFAFWVQQDFSSQGLTGETQERVLATIEQTWSATFPAVNLPSSGTIRISK